MPTNVDLLPNSGELTNTRHSAFFSWLSGSGKYILLLANSVLFILFIYRFYLDRDRVVLTKDISNLHSQITSLEESALEYDRVQSIVMTVEENKTTSINAKFILEVLKQVTPSGVEVDAISTRSDHLIITAVSYDPQTFSIFMDYFLREDSFLSVSLNSSTLSQETGAYTFTLDIQVDNKSINSKFN